MKKIFFPGVLLALLFIFSCSKDQFTEDDAVKAQQTLISYQDSIDQVRDSLEKVGGILQFSVSVIPVDAGTVFGTYKSTEAQNSLSGATVSVSQHGQLLTATTDESGIAVFTDLRVGTLNVFVSAADYTSGNFVVAVEPEAYDRGDAWNSAGVLRHAAIMVPVFNTESGTSTIEGVVTLETDLSNTTPEFANGVNVIASINDQDSAFRKKYFNMSCEGCDYKPNVISFGYAELTSSEPTDENGFYSISIPSSADGLPVILQVDEFAAPQSIFIDELYCTPVMGLQNNIRAVFGSGIAASEINYNADAAYVTFSEPTGIAVQKPVEKAEATAVIGESGIASVIIVDPGSGYTQAPNLVVDGDGTGAEVVAYITEGKVTSVEIVNPGTGYTAATITAESSVVDDAVAAETIEYGITEYNTVSANDGYESTPEVVITASAGSGATAEAIMTGYVDDINLDAMGSGYTCTPAVVISKDDATTVAKATATMTEFNPIYSIELTSNYTQKFEEVPDVMIVTDGYNEFVPGPGWTDHTGSGATAVVKLSDNGSIQDIVLSNRGAGYVEAPSVRIIGGGGTGAVAQAIVDDTDGSITIDVLEEGSGYASQPTIEISLPPVGGEAPVVQEVIIVKPIESITLTNPGEGYNIMENTGDKDNYYLEPAVFIGNDIDIDVDAPLADNEVIVRPNMKVAEVNLSNAGGEGYLDEPTITIVPTCGYGSGAEASTVVMLKVKEVVPVDFGSGYTDLSDIVVTIVTPPEGCKTQATTSAKTLGNGTLTDVEVTNAGEGYIAAPYVGLVINYNGGSTADNDTIQLMATVSNGMVTGVSFDGVEIPALTTNDLTSIIIRTQVSGASFTNGVYTQSGKISKVLISKAGAGYATAPTVKFIRVKPGTSSDYDVDNGVGANPRYLKVIEDGVFQPAEAEAVLADGRVVEINITNPGTGYYYEPIVEIEVLEEIAQAIGEVTISEGGFITGVTFDTDMDRGRGYEVAPIVEFHATYENDEDATGIAVVKDGKIVDVIMTNYGSGYYAGENTPAAELDCTLDAPDAYNSNAKFDVVAGKKYVKDIYLGTGQRDIDCNP